MSVKTAAGGGNEANRPVDSQDLNFPIFLSEAEVVTLGFHCLGWAISKKINADLVFAALKMAIETRSPDVG